MRQIVARLGLLDLHLKFSILLHETPLYLSNLIRTLHLDQDRKVQALQKEWERHLHGIARVLDSIPPYAKIEQIQQVFHGKANEIANHLSTLSRSLNPIRNDRLKTPLENRLASIYALLGQIHIELG